MRLNAVKIRQILTKFSLDIADQPISQIHVFNPQSHNVAVKFELDHQPWIVLFDESVNDDLEQAKRILSLESAELIANPNQPELAGLPWQNKTAYLVKVTSGKQRLDMLAAEKFTDQTRTQLKKLIKSGQVKVDGRVVTDPSSKHSPEAEIELLQPKFTVTKLDLPIIYEDELIIVINKPTGVLSEAKPSDQSEATVADFLRQRGDFAADDLRGGLVHRLDRETSGVMIGAKTVAAREYFKRQFQNRQVEKKYAALVSRPFQHNLFKIDLPLKRSTGSGKFVVHAAGRQAETVIKLVKRCPHKYYWLELEPKTGRTHQLRAHLAHLGNPIVGDGLYGGASADRLCLHANQIKFNHPNGQKMAFEAPIPTEFSKKCS